MEGHTENTHAGLMEVYGSVTVRVIEERFAKREDLLKRYNNSCTDIRPATRVDQIGIDELCTCFTKYTEEDLFVINK